jgi:AcrR family transcriptional regulator
MVSTPAVDWREARRRSARDAIVDAAWAAVREEGLASLSLRDLARRAGITTPTVYAYFDSKNAIYDAMFGRAAERFADRMFEPFDSEDPETILVSGVRRFVEFCTADVPRYQLLFQRVIPGFEPSPESYAHAVRALDVTRERLASVGIAKPAHLDLFTALVSGLVDQQVSNDPAGQRWTRLIDEAMTMFVAHCRAEPPAPKPTRNRRTDKGARP